MLDFEGLILYNDQLLLRKIMLTSQPRTLASSIANSLANRIREGPVTRLRALGGIQVSRETSSTKATISKSFLPRSIRFFNNVIIRDQNTRTECPLEFKSALKRAVMINRGIPVGNLVPFECRFVPNIDQVLCRHRRAETW